MLSAALCSPPYQAEPLLTLGDPASPVASLPGALWEVQALEWWHWTHRAKLPRRTEQRSFTGASWSPSVLSSLALEGMRNTHERRLRQFRP